MTDISGLLYQLRNRKDDIYAEIAADEIDRLMAGAEHDANTIKQLKRDIEYIHAIISNMKLTLAQDSFWRP